MLKLVQTPQCSLYGGISGTAVSAVITPYPADLDGNKLTMADFGDNPVVTLDPKIYGLEEICNFSGIVDNGNGTATLTGLTRDLLSKYPYYTSGSGGRSHGSTANVVFGDSPQIYGRLAAKENNEVITGLWTGPDPISLQGFATKNYVLSQITSGGTLILDALIIPATAEATITKGQIVYLNPSTGKWNVATSATASTCDNVILGIAQGAGTSGNLITNGVLIDGWDMNTQTGLTTNSLYYLSTAGAISTGAGTTKISLGFSGPTSTTFFFRPRYTTTITELQKAALAGNGGVPSSSNTYVTQIGLAATLVLHDADVDQSQLNQDSTYAVGQANTTTNHALVAQKFVPAKTAIRGVRMYKASDTGSFTGTVKVSIQADSAGSPSGSDLASYTISNAAWLKLTAGAQFGILFSTEYTALVAASPYWIVVTPSTTDSSNHPNLGVYSVGGYPSGALKFQNSTDGWVLTGTTMSYFATLEGFVSRIIETGTDGLMLPAPRPDRYIGGFNGNNSASNSTVNTTVNTTLASFQLEGGQIGINSGLKIRIIGSATVRYGNNNNDNAGFVIKYNGVAIASIGIQGNSASQDGYSSVDLEFRIINQGVASSQAYRFIGRASLTGSPTTNNLNPVGSGTSAADMSQPGLLEIVGNCTISSSTGTVGQTVALYGLFVDKIS